MKKTIIVILMILGFAVITVHGCLDTMKTKAQKELPQDCVNPMGEVLCESGKEGDE